jgi:hypothetical protein
MVHVTLSDDLATWQLVYYVVTLICIIFVSFRYVGAPISDRIFLRMYSIIRVIGCSAWIATIGAISDIAKRIANKLSFFGLLPLLYCLCNISRH